MSNEKILEGKLVQHVKTAGGLAIKLLPFLFAGLPDRMVLMPGARIWFVEMKSTGEKQSPIQKVIAKKLAKLGFPVLVIDTRDLLNEFFKQIA